MEQIQVELFTSAGNNAIIRMPGRQFPGIVVQGDSFSVLWSRAAAALALLRAPETHAEGLRELEDLAQTLDGQLRRYEAVLDAHGLHRPYHLPDRP